MSETVPALFDILGITTVEIPVNLSESNDKFRKRIKDACPGLKDEFRVYVDGCPYDIESKTDIWKFCVYYHEESSEDESWGENEDESYYGL
jgi:hypothetical protein